MSKRLNAILALLLIASLLVGCNAKPAAMSETASPTNTTTVSATTETIPPETTQETTAPTEPLSPAEEILAGMTLREKVGQLFIVQLEALNGKDSAAVTELTDTFISMLEQYPVGGLIFFADNIVSPGQIAQFNSDLQNISALPMFLAIDEEGGLVARLANHRAFNLTRYESAAAVGSSKDLTVSMEMGITIGTYLAKYGFNLNFAPVADVNTNPKNTVIGNRAFSTDAKTAAQAVKLISEGLNSRGIIATFKHFPGHGDTAEDSHVQLAVTHKSIDQLAECEFLPFKRADANDFVMVGHIAAPEVTDNMLPASMSPEMIGLLREHLGFEGLVITDSLSMNAITNSYTSAEAAVAALAAGCDILLMPENLEEAFDAVLTALEEETLTRSWLDETVLRILEFKMLHGILKY